MCIWNKLDESKTHNENEIPRILYKFCLLYQIYAIPYHCHHSLKLLLNCHTFLYVLAFKCMRSIYLPWTVVFPTDPPTQFELDCIAFCHCHPTDKIRGGTTVFLILRFVFIFSLLKKKIYQRKIPRGIKDEKISYSFCDIKLQGEDASLKKPTKTSFCSRVFLVPQGMLQPCRLSRMFLLQNHIC